MNLRNNKGFVGVDISVAVIILLVMVPTIMGLVFNISSVRKRSEVKTGALNIAINAIEAAKGTTLSDNATYKQEILNKIANIYNLSQDKEPTQDVEIIAAEDEAKIFLKYASYDLKIYVTDYSEDNTEALENYVKKVKAVVSYKITKDTETIDLTSIVR